MYFGFVGWQLLTMGKLIVQESGSTLGNTGAINRKKLQFASRDQESSSVPEGLLHPLRVFDQELALTFFPN